MLTNLTQNKKPSNPSWIRFMAPVTAQTTDSLFKSIDQVMLRGHDHIHLMISSPGGSVLHGLSAHNYLRGIGLPVTTYNFGSVDSIGVVIFCAGEERICVPHARFLIHGVSLQLQGNLKLDEKSIDEHLKSVKIDAHNIARVIADTAEKKLEEVEKSMLERTTLNPSQAKEYGLVTGIRRELYEGGQLHTIHEQGQILQSSQARSN
ncbi:ClpP family protease [Polynucleobacter sp. es-MAR-4]|uniref:ClpP family protease n=1 Tax=Polynucleobacter sp. es-MAR-4 TaxID=1855655 RepID=UPI001C0E5453|nr:ATP-dependent Clp protease proteolytic subunit [Polynucleobacter sp. es-MAR-4]MBU3636062.1 ATP-dependent Clp protease proteolytic subunit [Polynucleobacter sp. es-MAR-4]